MRLILKVLLYLLLGWLIYAVLGSTIPYLGRRSVSAENRQRLDNVSFYGTEENGPDRACVIETPHDALAVRMAMMRGAQNTLDIVTHTLRSDDTGAAFLAEMLDAADRGVQVRFILDGKAGGMNPQVAADLRALDSHPNISVRLYNPVNLLQPWYFHALLHDKFMIVDGEYLLLGGRNIDERHYEPAGYTRPTTHDRDMLVWRQGENRVDVISALDQTMEYMEEMWNLDFCKPVQKKPDEPGKKALDRYASMRATARAFEQANPWFYGDDLAAYRERTLPTRKITLIANPMHRWKKEPWVAYQIQRLVMGAQERVLVQTPYATANPRLIQAIAQASEQVELRVLTNSMASSPNYPAFSNYRFQRKRFISQGAQIYEYQNKDSIHAKSLVIDGRLSLVGSFNMDDRSMYIDTETMLVVDSPEFAAQLAEAIEGYLEQSLLVGEDNKYVLDEPGAPDALPVPVGKKALMGVAFVLLRPFQFLL